MQNLESCREDLIEVVYSLFSSSRPLWTVEPGMGSTRTESWVGESCCRVVCVSWSATAVNRGNEGWWCRGGSNSICCCCSSPLGRMRRRTSGLRVQRRGCSRRWESRGELRGWVERVREGFWFRVWLAEGRTEEEMVVGCWLKQGRRRHQRWLLAGFERKWRLS